MYLCNCFASRNLREAREFNEDSVRAYLESQSADKQGDLIRACNNLQDASCSDQEARTSRRLVDATITAMYGEKTGSKKFSCGGMCRGDISKLIQSWASGKNQCHHAKDKALDCVPA